MDEITHTLRGVGGHREVLVSWPAVVEAELYRQATARGVPPDTVLREWVTHGVTLDLHGRPGAGAATVTVTARS